MCLVCQYICRHLPTYQWNRIKVKWLLKMRNNNLIIKSEFIIIKFITIRRGAAWRGAQAIDKSEESFALVRSLDQRQLIIIILIVCVREALTTVARSYSEIHIFICARCRTSPVRRFELWHYAFGRKKRKITQNMKLKTKTAITSDAPRRAALFI